MSASHPITLPTRAKRPSERLWDACSLALIAAGVALFFFARHALQAMGAGTYDLPPGTSAVARTDLHVLQSHAGITLVCIGLLTGVWATWKGRG